MSSLQFKEYPPEKLEKETRILLAFETVRCPNTKQ